MLHACQPRSRTPSPGELTIGEDARLKTCAACRRNVSFDKAVGLLFVVLSKETRTTLDPVGWQIDAMWSTVRAERDGLGAGKQTHLRMYHQRKKVTCCGALLVVHRPNSFRFPARLSLKVKLLCSRKLCRMMLKFETTPDRKVFSRRRSLRLRRATTERRNT